MRKLFRNSIRIASVIMLGAAAVFGLSGSARAAEQMKGGPHMLHLQGISTQAEAETLKPGATIAMVCAKCKSVTVENVTTQKGHIKTVTVGEKHLCPGCNSTITVVGTGKDKHDAVKHSCEKCGDDSAFCCATKPGSAPTKGMEKNQK